MSYTARPYVLHEANYKQVMALNPNVALLPWGATEAHNYHLPYGTDVIEANAVAEEATRLANEQGARCILLPCVPFGIDHTQLNQKATVTMRASTQQAVLRDVAESMVKQGIDRLIVMNFHGGNDFISMIRDIMLDLPIFIVQVHGYMTDPNVKNVLSNPEGFHANEFETSMMLYITPQWVDDLDKADDAPVKASAIPSLVNTPGVSFVRNWPALTESTGVGNPKQATAEKGKKIIDLLAEAMAKIIAELSKAKRGVYPFIIDERK